MAALNGSRCNPVFIAQRWEPGSMMEKPVAIQANGSGQLLLLIKV